MTVSQRAGRFVGLPVLLAMSLLLVAAKADAAPAAPAWSITATSQPTNFAPKSAMNSKGIGPRYYIVATNAGGADMTEPFTVVDQLPPGVSPSPAKAPSGEYGKEATGSGTPMSCGVASESVTCTSEPGVLHPGEKVIVAVPVKLSATATGEITNTASVFGGGAPSAATVSNVTNVDSEPAPFSLMSGSDAPRATASAGDGSATILAGSHPYRLAIGFTFPGYQAEPAGIDIYGTGGGVRDLLTTLPPGVVVNPAAVSKCTERELVSEAGCPSGSQVGTVQVVVSLGGGNAGTRALYNMVTPGGSPGVFGFEVAKGIYQHLVGHLNSEGRYELAASANDILAKVGVLGATVMLWGDPTAASHDGQRGNACIVGFSIECPTERKNTAFLTMPSACSPLLGMAAEADAWETPGEFERRTFAVTGLEGSPISISGCSALEFNPLIKLKPENTRADSPTGLAVDLHVPQKLEYEDVAGNISAATSTLKDAKVVLPAGVSINPASANGRTACTAGQIGLTTPVGQAEAHFTDDRPECPDASKIGAAEVETPLLKDEVNGAQSPHVLPGSIYLAQPFENPFNSLLAVYIAVFDPQTGVVLKLPGEVQADSTTGQLTATFKENPQLPFEDFHLEFFGGDRAALRTPSTCSSYSSQSELTPWSGGAPVSSSEDFPVNAAASGGSCPNTPAQEPNQPSFEAGTVSPLAGAYSPFVLKLKREDGSQELGALNLTLPEGLTGKLAGTPYCPESALAEAAMKKGREEQAHPSCPQASEVGTVTVGAGAGSQPLYVQGKAYLTGPYRGAPLSLAIVTPAVAGPYDLGTVVVRSALQVNPLNAQITVESDPLPKILQGIPLDIRSVTVEMSKPNFTLNATSCEPMSITGDAISTIGQKASLSARYQAAGCAKLKFNPHLKITLKGATKRSGHPALKAVLTYPKGTNYSNVGRAQVALPHSEFLDQGNLNKVCTQPQLKSQTCPASSIYGHAKAWTPLLDKPLEGPVYLAVGFGYKLPALVAELNGQIRFLLVGKVDTTKKHGIRNTFETAPDAPVSKFILELKGGKKYGLLENSENICKKPQKAAVRLNAHNGRIAESTPRIGNSCGSKKKAKKGAKQKQNNSKGR